MFCPECKAEYRQGFTRCADCEVDLVAALQGRKSRPRKPQSRPRIEEGGSGELEPQVWQGTDPHFYLGVLKYLRTVGMPCRGGPVNPPEYDSFDAEPLRGFSRPEFEICVSKENLPLAQWMVQSWKEKYDETAAEDERIAKDGLERYPEYEEEVEESQESPKSDPRSECPLCGADFDPAVGTCPNCDVPLQTAWEKSQGRNAGRPLSLMPHPGFYSALREALRRAGIPYNNRVHEKELSTGPVPFALEVLNSDFERATDVMAHLLQYWEFGEGLAVSSGPDPRDSYWPRKAEERGLHLEDLTAPVWQGTNYFTLAGVGMALHEHEIAYQVDSPEPGSAKVLVHPEDEQEARKILTGVVMGRWLKASR